MTESAAGRGHNRNRVAGLHRSLRSAWQLFDGTRQTADDVVADLAGLAAFQAKRRHPAVSGQDGAVHRFAETNGTARAVTGMPAALAAGPFADVKILEQNGVAEFEDQDEDEEDLTANRR